MRRNLCFVVLIALLVVIHLAPVKWVPHHVEKLKDVQFSFVWSHTDEPAAVKLGDLGLRVVAPPQEATDIAAEILAQKPGSGEGRASSAKALSKPQAANFSALTNLGLLAVAFILAASASIAFSLTSTREINKSKRGSRGERLFYRRSAIVALVGVVTGVVLVLMDSVGPIVTQDVGDWTCSVRGGETSHNNPIKAAIAQEIVDCPTAHLVSGLILLCGAVGGITSFCFLHYVFAVGGSRGDSVQMLRARRENLSLCVTSASIALSLGVAVIMTFLGWGLGFLDDASREVAAIIIDASTLYYGGTLAIIAVTGSAFAFFCLRSDIKEAAGKRHSNGKPISELDWMKKHDLEFEPLKAVSTFFVALGPALTPGLLEVLGKSVG